MLTIEEENDKLVQIWASKKRSYISGKASQCGHHFYSRKNKLLRWDLMNIIPCTLEEHTKIHSGELSYTINPCREEYLLRMVNKNYKDFLFENNLTDKEFCEKCNKRLKEAVCE